MVHPANNETNPAVPKKNPLDIIDDERGLVVRSGGYNLQIHYDPDKRLMARAKPGAPENYVAITVAVWPTRSEDDRDEVVEEGAEEEDEVELGGSKSVVPDECARMFDLVMPRGGGNSEEFEANVRASLETILSEEDNNFDISAVPKTTAEYLKGAANIQVKLRSIFGEVPELGKPDEDDDRDIERDMLRIFIRQNENLNHLHFERDTTVMTKKLPAELADAFPEYAAHRASFGPVMKSMREASGIDVEKLAKTMIALLSEGAQPVTTQQVENWEIGRGNLPDEEQFNAIATILITNNKALAEGADKDAAMQKLRQAYDSTLEARAAGNFGIEAFAFADTLKAMRENTKNGRKLVTPQDLAEGITTIISGEVPELEAALLKHEKGYFIDGVEAGVIVPSKPMLLTVVKAFERLDKALSEDEKDALYKKYDLIEQEPVHHRGNNGVKREYKPYDKEAFKQLKLKLVAELTAKGTPPDLEAIRELCKLDKANLAVRAVLDTEKDKNVFRYSALSKTVEEGILAYAAQLFPKDASKLTGVQAIIQEMRALTRFRPRAIGSREDEGDASVVAAASAR